MFVGVVWQPSMGAGVVLPDRTVVAGLPAFDGFAEGFVTGVGSEVMFAGPAADTGAVGFEVEATVEFAGDGAVRGRRFGGEEFGGQCGHLGGPVGVVIAAGNPGRPSFDLAVSTGVEVLGEELVKAGTGEPQFLSCGLGGEFLSAMAGQEMADEWSRATFDELGFFIRVRMSENDGFIALELTPAGAWPSRAATSVTARPAVCQASGGARVASPQSPILR